MLSFQRLTGLTAVLGVFMLAATTPFSVFAGLPVAVDGMKLPSLAPVLERITPAVVNISTKSHIKVVENPLLSDPFFRRFFNLPRHPRHQQSQSLGSGVVIDAKQGFIITNNHVIEKADEITVTLRDGRRFNAKLVGTDPDTDVAVIKISADNLTSLKLADSDKLRVGDFVVAIGNPFGLGQTVTSGIVSALGRSGLGIEGYEDFIQTDASINPGNSGGALINLRGELVGINTAILARGGGNIGIGFAIPSNMAYQIMQQLVSYGKVERGQLGVAVQDLTPDLAKAFNLDSNRKGAVVVEVHQGGPAHKAGIKPGDIVVSINGKQVDDASDVRTSIGLLRVGDKVELGVFRNGKHLSLGAVIAGAKQVSVDVDGLGAHLTGAEFSNIDAGHPLHGRISGVLVRDVKRGSSASAIGLRKGDIIIAVNRMRVRNVKELLAAVKKTSNQLLLQIRRGRASVTLLLR